MSTRGITQLLWKESSRLGLRFNIRATIITSTDYHENFWKLISETKLKDFLLRARGKYICIAFPQLLARAFLSSGTALYRIWRHESESRSSPCHHYYTKQHHLTISKCYFSHCLQDIPSFLSSPWRRTRYVVRHVSEAESFMTTLWSIPAMQQTQNTKSKNLNQCRIQTLR